MPNSVSPLTHIRLLIVEDEPLIALMVEDFAIELGCTAYRKASSVEQALEAIKTFVPQLALVDCTLSRGGPSFLVADALVDADIPLIFTSGHSSNIVPIRHRDRDFLAKPFSIEQLREAIEKLRLESGSGANDPH